MHDAQGMFFSALSAHDEERKGGRVPYPAAGVLGKHPEVIAAPFPRDDIELSEGDAEGGEVDKPAEGAGTADAALLVPQGYRCIADLLGYALPVRPTWPGPLCPTAGQ